MVAQTHWYVSSFSKLTLELALEVRALNITIGRPDNKQNRCRTGEEGECEELCFRRSSPLACGLWAMQALVKIIK